MPIEIRELVIRVTVQDETQQPAPAVGPPGPDLRRWQQELTQACVQEVLAKLRRRAER